LFCCIVLVEDETGVAIQDFVESMYQHTDEHSRLMRQCDRMASKYEQQMSKLNARRLKEAKEVDFGCDSKRLKTAAELNILEEPTMGLIPANQGNDATRTSIAMPTTSATTSNVKNNNNTNPQGKRWRSSGGGASSTLPRDATSYMKEWLYSHRDNPYPTQEEKDVISKETQLSMKQINNWFINARRRYLKRTKEKRKKRKSLSGGRGWSKGTSRIDDDDDGWD